MHPSEYVVAYTDKCRNAGHSITETREVQLLGETYLYNTCKCGVKSRV